MSASRRSTVRALCIAGALLASTLPAQAQQPVREPAPNFADTVEAAYRWGDFPQLERFFEGSRRASVRSEQTGVPRLREFWRGIDRVSESSLRITEEYHQQLENQARQWAREHPRSLLAQMLYGKTLITHGWAIRGGGYANTVSPAANAEFTRYLDLAVAQLKKAEPLAGADSSWNVLMLQVGRGRGWDRALLGQLFEQGLAKDPDNDQLYFTMQGALLPKWGGDVRTVERFIEFATRQTRDRLGLEMYARLYAALSYDDLKQSLFTASRASWADMKKGFEDRLARHDHVEHRNMYAYFACMAEDREALREQLARIGEKFDKALWGDSPERAFALCKRLAQQT